MDFYAISEHWRNVDKTPALNSAKEASEIAFVTLAEAGSIDAVTAGEHKDIFSPWKTGIAYTVGQYRNYVGKTCTAAFRRTLRPFLMGAGRRREPLDAGSRPDGGMAGMEPARRCP